MIFKFQRNVYRQISFVHTCVAYHIYIDIRIDHDDKALYRFILCAIKSIKRMRIQLIIA